jgi:hypothetical protein
MTIMERKWIMETIKRNILTIVVVAILLLLSAAATVVFANATGTPDGEGYRCTGCQHVERAAKIWQ